MSRRRPRLPDQWSQLGPVPVQIVENLTDKQSGEQRLAGEADMYERSIRLDSALPPRAQRVTLLHELIHLWLHDAGVDLPHDMEEVVCCTLSTAFVAHEDFTRKHKRPPRRKTG